MLNFNEIFGIISSDNASLSTQENTLLQEQLKTLLEVNGFTTQAIYIVDNDKRKNAYLVKGSRAHNGWPLAQLMLSLTDAYHQDSFIVCEGTGFVSKIFPRKSYSRCYYSVQNSKIDDSYYLIIEDQKITLK